MNMLCDLFNRYRDGMLNADQTIRFESHLAGCSRCRAHLFLLNNMVHVIRNQDMQDPTYSPERISARAYEQSQSWDALLLSWLKPLPAWSLAALLVLASLLWLAPFVRQPASGSNYEDLMMTSGDLAGSAIADFTDTELETWLEQGGAIQ